MKKITVSISALFLALGVLSGCGEKKKKRRKRKHLLLSKSLLNKLLNPQRPPQNLHQPLPQQ
ncbi:hypothetical protein [Thiothrix subterranea]|uniref:hypothetical protein n=1 Tax=Thiothrix subterranea TaxID=2735563 RepID=UPI00280B891A|nr:hypothetical protein [Thiothrix subterranea]